MNLRPLTNNLCFTALYTRSGNCYGASLIAARQRLYYVGSAEKVNTTMRGTFECPRCSKIYKWYRGLHRHLKYECGKEPRFKCPHCVYTGKHRSHVYSHIKSNHRNQPIYALDIQQG